MIVLRNIMNYVLNQVLNKCHLKAVGIAHAEFYGYIYPGYSSECNFAKFPVPLSET